MRNLASAASLAEAAQAVAASQAEEAFAPVAEALQTTPAVVEVPAAQVWRLWLK